MQAIKDSKTESQDIIHDNCKFLHVSAQECHPQGVYLNTGIQVQYANPRDHYSSMCVGPAFLCSARLPQDGTPVPKHIGTETP
jgi:hypothetical protein